MLASRLTLSINTSLPIVSQDLTQVRRDDIQFIQAANRGANCFPEGEQQADLRERLLPSRQGLSLAALLVSLSLVWLHLSSVSTKTP